LNPKILKLPGLTNEHMKSYGKNGCFELGGVFYSKEDCTIETKLTKNILILDCGNESDLDSFCSDLFIQFVTSNSDINVDFFVHLSHPDLIESTQYLELLENFQKRNSKADHIYIHPEFTSNERLFFEQKEIFNDIDYNLLTRHFNGRAY
jgi:predicted outer membrane repeat protein